MRNKPPKASKRRAAQPCVAVVHLFGSLLLRPEGIILFKRHVVCCFAVYSLRISGCMPLHRREFAYEPAARSHPNCQLQLLITTATPCGSFCLFSTTLMRYGALSLTSQVHEGAAL